MRESYNTLIFFTDLINSSSLSSFMGKKKFADWVLDGFHKHFYELATAYFQDQCKIHVAGDEGFIFLPIRRGMDPIFEAQNMINFVFELKTLIKIEGVDSKDPPPHGLRLATGIHYGEIIIESELKGTKIIDKKYVGYNINYGKRIETCSREGIYSNIFISNSIYRLLSSKYPIIFKEHTFDLKGIEKNSKIYEIQNVFLTERAKKLHDEKLSDYFNPDSPKCICFGELRDPWINSYLLSIVSQKYNSAVGPRNQKLFRDRFHNLLFKNIVNDDPIIDYVQALEFTINKDYTLAISKLKKLYENHPDFIYAKIVLLKNLVEISKNPKVIDSELIYIRDSINEMLNYHDNSITGNDKEDLENLDTEIQKLLLKKK